VADRVFNNVSGTCKTSDPCLAERDTPLDDAAFQGVPVAPRLALLGFCKCLVRNAGNSAVLQLLAICEAHVFTSKVQRHFSNTPIAVFDDIGESK